MDGRGTGEGFGEIKSVTLPSADQNKAKVTYTYSTSGYNPAVTWVLENKVIQKTQKYLNQYDNPTTFDNPANYVTEIWKYSSASQYTGGANTVTSPDGSVATEWSYGSGYGYNPATAWKCKVYEASQCSIHITAKPA